MLVPILVFHKIGPVPPETHVRCNYVRPEQFDALLGSLRGAGYEGISFDQYLAHRRGKGTLPRKPILLTFDDGYTSNAEVAVPILRKHAFTLPFSWYRGGLAVRMPGTRTRRRNRGRLAYVPSATRGHSTMPPSIS
ncbi:MAG TPA: polysaccharide deacetylase family protein [Gemmatimonadaceae bacterium]